MPWGPRVAETSPKQAEGDKTYYFAVYNDTSGNLTAYMPVCKDLSDSAEFNVIQSTTALTVGPNLNAQTAGKVVLSSNVFAGGISTGSVPELFGIYSPTNPQDKPSTGDVIRVMTFGSTPVQISSGQSPNVGDYLQVVTQDNLAHVIPRANNAPSNGMKIGRITGTTSSISLGQSVSAPGFQFGFLVNGFVNPQ